MKFLKIGEKNIINLDNVNSIFIDKNMDSINSEIPDRIVIFYFNDANKLIYRNEEADTIIDYFDNSVIFGESPRIRL